MKNRNVMSALAITTALLTIGATALPTSSHYSSALTSTNTSVGQTSSLFTVKITRDSTIRSGPGLSYPSVKIISEGSQWYVLNVNNGWYKIAENQWIQQTFTVKSIPIKQIRGATKAGYIRSGPYTTAPIVGVLSQNTVKDVLEMSYGWYKIGNYEYINNSYVVDAGGSQFKQGTVIKPLTSVMSGPGFNYSEVKQISTGTIVSIYGYSLGWLRIGNNEWIISNSIQPLN